MASSIELSVCSTSGAQAEYTSSMGNTASPAANLRVFGLSASFCDLTSSMSSGVGSLEMSRAMVSSKSSPPSRETPLEVTTSFCLPSMWMSDASKVPPPRS